MFTMRNAVLLCMAIAIIATAFAVVVGQPFNPTDYLKATAAAATGIAALFMHPPTVTSSSQTAATNQGSSP